MKMDKEEKEMGRAKGESRIDYHIKITKMALNPNAVYDALPKRETTQNYPSDEFGFNNPSSQIVRQFLWLCAKLLILYLAKGISWLISRRAA